MWYIYSIPHLNVVISLSVQMTNIWAAALLESVDILHVVLWCFQTTERRSSDQLSSNVWIGFLPSGTFPACAVMLMRWHSIYIYIFFFCRPPECLQDLQQENQWFKKSQSITMAPKLSNFDFLSLYPEWTQVKSDQRGNFIWIEFSSKMDFVLRFIFLKGSLCFW